MNIETNVLERDPGEQDPRPIVALRRQHVPGMLFVIIGIVAAILLFLTLDAQRRRLAAPRTHSSPTSAFAPPPPLMIPAEPITEPQQVRIVPAPVPQLAPAPLRPPPFYPAEPPPPPEMRPLPPQRPLPEAAPKSEPALVVDSAPAAGETGSKGNRGNLIAAGTLIPAVLETPIDTAKPGLVRAMVSKDTLGFDGKKILIPRGSRLIGEYQSDVRPGQNRVLVNWTRLIRPDGVAIALASPAADSMGGAGIPGTVNSFFFERFLDAAVQTVMTVAGNLTTRSTSNTVIVGVPAGTAPATVVQGATSGNDRRPKIKVKQGTLFNVFVARDLDVPKVGLVL
jgi:type IV secretion system protein VirB10